MKAMFDFAIKYCAPILPEIFGKFAKYGVPGGVATATSSTQGIFMFEAEVTGSVRLMLDGNQVIRVLVGVEEDRIWRWLVCLQPVEANPADPDSWETVKLDYFVPTYAGVPPIPFERPNREDALKQGIAAGRKWAERKLSNCWSDCQVDWGNEIYPLQKGDSKIS